MIHRTFLTSIVSGLLLATAPVLYAASGDITYVPGISANGSSADAINDAGVVVGCSYDAGDLWHLIRYSGGVTQDLGQLSAGHTVGLDINSSGTIVGWGGADAGYNYYRAFQYPSGGPLEPLPELAGYTLSSLAKGINDSGTIVGAAGGPLSTIRAFRLTPGGSMENLGTLGGSQSWANDINSNGTIVGLSALSNGIRHAFRYSGNGPMVDMGSFSAGGETQAGAINDLGVVAGYEWYSVDPRTNGGITSRSRAIRWDAADTAYELALLPGWTEAEAIALNNSGTIVGRTFNADDVQAMLWLPDGTPVDLNAWLDAINPETGAHWNLLYAYDINAAGQVVGVGEYDDGPGGLPDGGYGFILDTTSVPEPSTLSLLLLAPASLLRRFRRS